MWRIKTFEEFGNKRPISWNSRGKMDYLYGTEIPKEMWKRCELGNNLFIKTKDNRDYYCWTINSSGYIFDKLFLEPNYEIY